MKLNIKAVVCTLLLSMSQILCGSVLRPPTPSIDTPVDYTGYCKQLDRNKSVKFSESLIFTDFFRPDRQARYDLQAICNNAFRDKDKSLNLQRYFARVEPKFEELKQSIDNGIYVEIYKSKSDDKLIGVPRFSADASIALIAFELQQERVDKNDFKGLFEAWKYGLCLCEQFDKTNILVAHLISNKIRGVVYESILSVVDHKKFYLEDMLSELIFKNKFTMSYVDILNFQLATSYDMQQELFDVSGVDNKLLKMYGLKHETKESYYSFHANAKYLNDYFLHLEDLFEDKEQVHLLDEVSSYEKIKGPLASDRVVVMQEAIPLFSIALKSDIQNEIAYTCAQICLALESFKEKQRIYPESLHSCVNSSPYLTELTLKNWKFKRINNGYRLIYQGGLTY